MKDSAKRRRAGPSASASAVGSAALLREAYLRAFNLRASEVDWEDVEPDLIAVRDATSDRKAGAVIAWWGGWGAVQPFHSPTAAARELRRLMRVKP
jgi:hypothetical protein